MSRLHTAFVLGYHGCDRAVFDTVRGLFTEGGPLFPGSGFRAKTHVQVAVRSADNIKGYFRVPQI